MSPEPLRRRPHALVLGVGGIVGEAWTTGVLAGLEEAAGIDFRATDRIIGTSAGSVVAAHLVSGGSPRRPERIPGAPDVDHGDRGGGSDPLALALAAALEAASATVKVAESVGAPLLPAALRLSEPAGAAVRAAALAALPEGRRTIPGLREAVARTGARFDGRLRVVAVDRASGRRVVFGDPDGRAPAAPVADAVAASCAMPLVMRPVEIAGRRYVDGGAWSPTNLDLAPAGRGDEVLCLMPVASTTAAARSPVVALKVLARSAATIEAAALRRRGARVRLVRPDRAAARAMGGDMMAGHAAAGALLAGHRQGLALAGEAVAEDDDPARRPGRGPSRPRPRGRRRTASPPATAPA